MRYVIIGNSAAAVGCVEGIRSVDKTGLITIISSEKHHAYSRPLISYLLQGKTDLERMKYRPDSFYENMGCETKLGVRAESIDPEKKLVRLENGEEITYGKLLISTGSVPFIPPMEGLERVEKKFTFMSLDDAQALESALTPESRVLILGAGLIGLKCAEGILDHVKSIQVVDLADRVLPSILDEAGSLRVRQHLEEKGLKFFLGDSAAKFDKNSAVLKSGRKLSFDILVIAVGVRPNDSLIREAGGKADRGIEADSAGLTSLPDVYAAGDCCKSLDITSGQNRVLALMPNAYLQGECAGKNMAGQPTSFDKAAPMNAIGFFGLHMITAGSYTGEKLVEETPEHYKAFFVENDLLKGFILIGDCMDSAGIYTSLMRERTPLDTVDFKLLRERPQFMAFSPEQRREKFGR